MFLHFQLFSLRCCMPNYHFIAYFLLKTFRAEIKRCKRDTPYNLILKGKSETLLEQNIKMVTDCFLAWKD